MVILLLLFLNIFFVVALWHMDVNHNLDKLEQNLTRGILKIKPEQAYRLSQYALIICLFLLDILFIITFSQRSF